MYRVAIYSLFLLIGDESGDFPNKNLSFSLREVNRKTKSLVLIFLLQNVSCYYIASRFFAKQRTGMFSQGVFISISSCFSIELKVTKDCFEILSL